MLICGFEKFDNFFVRIDILERLFIQIINSGNEKNKEVVLVPEMLNLLGCSKDNFVKLIKKMNYKSTEKENKTPHNLLTKSTQIRTPHFLLCLRKKYN